jgi:eukaryotic-like serine/threonine-protein kinase
LACVLYEMLAGEPPFTGPTVEAVVYQHLAVEALPVTHLRPTVPEKLEMALKRAMAKAPADRFQSATDFAQVIRSGGAEVLVP